MLAFSEARGDDPGITGVSPQTGKNPYRAILRREIPEPFIALLCFILGIWIWDHYFGKTVGYAPGTEEIALIKIDRDMRLALEMERDPALLRWLAHATTVPEAVEDGIRSLEILIQARSLGPGGHYAYVALLAERDRLPVSTYLHQLSFPSDDPDSENWWNWKIKEEMTGREAINPHRSLRTRAVLVGGIIWGLAILGLAFLPQALRCLRGAFRHRPRGYTSRWPAGLGLTVFLVATLAWIGFSLLMEIGVAMLPEIPPALAILIDTVARILPTAIALGLLFRKIGHIPRSLGLNGNIHPPVLIGLFALLCLIDQPLRWALGRFVREDPTGGLSMADSGVAGLVFAIISACIFAPIAEEILYRGILHRSLANRIGVLAAAFCSAVVFGLLHFYDYYGFASVATFGFFCALLYQATGSLIDVIALHMLYNASITLPAWTIYHAPL